jgi:hypothetical protein
MFQKQIHPLYEPPSPPLNSLLGKKPSDKRTKQIDLIQNNKPEVSACNYTQLETLGEEYCEELNLMQKKHIMHHYFNIPVDQGNLLNFIYIIFKNKKNKR